MNHFKYPTAEGAKEVAIALGISADEILQQGQDWEYTFPTNPVQIKDLRWAG
jgi:hypothetical protein